MATLILVGHGSSCDSGAGAPVRAHAARVRAAGGFRRVLPAFWRETPHVRQVVAGIHDDDVVLVPMFMSDGYFAGQVLPRALGLTLPVTRRGARRIHYTRPIGLHPRIPELAELRAREAGAGAASAIVIAGHGTDRHTRSEDSTWAAVRALRETNRYAAVVGGFLDQEPRLQRSVALLESPHVVVVPLFLGDGDHTARDIPAIVTRVRLPGRTIRIARPVGTLPQIAEIVADLARGALGERTPAGQATRALADAALGDGDFRGSDPLTPASLTPGGDVWAPSIS